VSCCRDLESALSRVFTNGRLPLLTANMKVITAIYLHVRPDLRDEWLAGVDVDTDVEESLVRLSLPPLILHTLNLALH